jgi:rare lipoprotein A
MREIVAAALPRFVVLAGLMVLGACSSSREGIPRATGTPYKLYMVGAPYQVGGRWYYPRENLDYDAAGVASWYGESYHGRPTANGEIYNMHAMTAAHPTLPMPTIARVTNLANGRSILVRINDRGPFVEDRIIDMSYAGARALGFADHGIANVRVTVLREASLRLKEQAQGSGYAMLSP